MADKPPLRLTPLNRVLSPPLNLYPPNTPPDLYASALNHFISIPCPGPIITFIPQCFNPLSPHHDQFVGATLASHLRGLNHMLSFFRASQLHDPTQPIQRVDTLFSLGDGLSGYEGLLHGGMTATMMDEAMGTVNEINTALGKEGLVYQRSSVTAEMEIQFLRPVRVPGVVCVAAWREGGEGRKTRMRCEVRDGEGEVLVRGRSTWVAMKENL